MTSKLKYTLVAVLISLTAIVYLNHAYKILQRIENLVFHPGIGCCERCYRTWDIVTIHSTWYDLNDVMQKVKIEGINYAIITPIERKGCFPLCQDCWQDLETPEARLPFYRRLMDQWERIDRDMDRHLGREMEWEGMKAAVLAGG